LQESGEALLFAFIQRWRRGGRHDTVWHHDRPAEAPSLSELRAVALFGSALVDPESARDLDLALFPRPGADPDRIALGAGLSEATGRKTDVVVIDAGASATLGMEIVRRHRLLHEETPGAFEEILSLLQRRFFDAEKFRRRRNQRLDAFATGRRHVA